MNNTVDRALKEFANRNFTLAKPLLENFEAATDPEAMYALGEIYYSGLAGAVCRESGIKYFQIAAALGSVAAMLRIAGEIELSSRKANEAETFLRLASKNGSFNAEKRLGFYALDRTGLDQNKQILRAAKHGNVECMLEYALRVQRGHAIPDYVHRSGFFEERRAKQQAVSECLDHWYTKAASAGNIDVIRYMFTGWGPNPGTPKLFGVPANCKNELHKRAENGEVLALGIVGFSLLYNSNEFYHGLSLDKAIQRAMVYLFEAARNGNQFAAGQLAWEYSYGKNIAHDYEIALALALASKNMDPEYSPDVEGHLDIMLPDLERKVQLSRLDAIRQCPWSFIKL